MLRVGLHFGRAIVRTAFAAFHAILPGKWRTRAAERNRLKAALSWRDPGAAPFALSITVSD
jgi:hypothetical protein